MSHVYLVQHMGQEIFVVRANSAGDARHLVYTHLIQEGYQGTVLPGLTIQVCGNLTSIASEANLEMTLIL